MTATVEPMPVRGMVAPARTVLTTILLGLLSLPGHSGESAVALEPFVINHQAGDEARMDLSFLLEAPAGEHGFVTAEGDHFHTGDGRRIRFWGVNITDWSRGSTAIPAKENAEAWASALARHGINIVRGHFLDLLAPRGLIAADRSDTRHFDPEQLDRLDYWVHQLKEHGIYFNFNLVVGRSYKEGDGVTDHEDVGWAKYITYFDPQLIALQKELAEMWLTHENPYTGTQYRNEPAIVMFELLNENTLFDAWHRDALHPPEQMPSSSNFKPITPYYSDMLDRLFNAWLEENYTAGELARLREQVGVEEGNPLPRVRKEEALSEGAPDDLFHATMAFYMHVERSYFEEMQRFLKDEVGLKSLLLGTSDFLHMRGQAYPMVWSNSVLDFIGGHTYWQHPNVEGVVNTPAVDDPGFSSFMRLSRTALSGKPYVVPEVNHPSPNFYESEGFPLLAAYGSLQDWSGIIFYTFEPKRSWDQEAFIGDAFDISHHPVKMPQMAAGALMFGRGDVRVAEETRERTYTMEQLRESMRRPAEETPYFTPEFDHLLALKHGVRIGSLAGPPTREQRMEEEYPIVSDTGELAWYPPRDGRRGMVRIDAPRSQGLIGFLRDHAVSTMNLSAEMENEFASITLSSLDEESVALSSSSRMLLVAGGRAENEGTDWDEARMRTTSRGGPPSLIEVITGRITLRGLEGASSVRVYPLDGAGRWMGEPVMGEQSGSDWTFSVGERVTTWYEIIVDR